MEPGNKSVDNCFILHKDNFAEFFQTLQSLGTVYAPVRVSEQSYSFKSVQAPQEIAFEALRTILPPKKFFYPQQETILTYSADKIEETAAPVDFQVIFGVHPCDLAGLGIMDTIFDAGPGDTHYQRRREKSLIVGLSCLPDRHCFCQSMGSECPENGYDLFLTDLDESFFIEVRTARGASLLKQIAHILKEAVGEDKESYKKYWNKRSEMFTNGFKPDNLRSVMDMEWNNKIWEDLGNRCLSCGNCTPVCPTCYCFDLVDIASLNGEEGERRREWDSCQFVGFAQVAGETNFRPTPVDRLKFWYRHKLHGFDDPYGLKTCVGCGRCTVSCPSGIDDLVSVVIQLQANRRETSPQEKSTDNE